MKFLFNLINIFLLKDHDLIGPISLSQPQIACIKLLVRHLVSLDLRMRPLTPEANVEDAEKLEIITAFYRNIQKPLFDFIITTLHSSVYDENVLGSIDAWADYVLPWNFEKDSSFTSNSGQFLKSSVKKRLSEEWYGSLFFLIMRSLILIH